MDATLLIAEHPSLSRDALESFLVRCGFHVETAGDGPECLSALRALEPDVLVVDSELPWGGAAGVVAFLNETRFEFEMPAILVVGEQSPAVLSERIGVPDSCCLEKPVPTDELLDWVGLAMAAICLRRDGEPAFDGHRLGDSRQERTCLVGAT